MIKVFEMTKDDFNAKRNSLKAAWENFWQDSKKGTDLSNEIIERYPLQAAGYLRESMTSGGLGYTDISYLRKNKKKSTLMMDIKTKYNLDMNDINIMFSSEGYHEAEIKDALRFGKVVPAEVLQDYPELNK